MSVVRYLSHPQVRIDPDVAVPDWGLNDVGKGRVEGIARAPILRATTAVISSDERKAIETAEPIARALGVEPIVNAAMHENDRSATGYLEPSEFEHIADLFFANPAESVRGWERAVDAQRRIVEAVKAALQAAPVGDVLFVGHGGVGTLLYCHLANERIDRQFDQPAGGGNVFAFTRDPMSIDHHWQPMEDALK